MSITTAELTGLRIAADNWLSDTCTIQTATTAVDAMGGVTVTFANTYTGVYCRIDPDTSRGAESVRNFTQEGKALYLGSFKYDQAIAVTDRVVHSGQTYEVLQIVTDNTWGTLNLARLVRID